MTRLITLADAEELAEVVVRNRDFMAPWDPLRPEEFFTVAGQRGVIEHLLSGHEGGSILPHVILADDGRIAGRVTLAGIVRGPLQSCGVGYWVEQDLNGRGLATAAVARLKRAAFDDLNLHRIQAETLAHNAASQRVLARNGFRRFGYAPAYLSIAGRWQDHVMFQVVNEAWQQP